MEALRQLRLRGRHSVLARYQVDLAAPDIDIDVFRKWLAVVVRLDPPITLLLAPDDRTLAVSTHAARGHPRIGAVNVSDPALQEAAQNLGLRVTSHPSNHLTAHDMVASRRWPLLRH